MKNISYHANGFELIRSEPIPVYTYDAEIEPRPINKPQYYQILGALAKKLTYLEKKPIVSIDGYLESLPIEINSTKNQEINLPQVGKFKIKLIEIENKEIPVADFMNYSHLVNRMADVALTIYSKDYYKFHPKAPYILRDEPYFDKNLIEKTGILDSKSYYRGIMKLGDKTVFVLNRETQLRSNNNLLVELKSLAKLYDELNGTTIDFYNPPLAFVNFVNHLLKGKSAEVSRRYPGPSVKRIDGITWKYRAGEKIKSIGGSPAEYLNKTYGVSELDPNQPLVFYEIENSQKVQYHVPEVLSVGHNFEDLRKRIPSWQRTQVWGSVHPDCKNQLHKIYDVMLEIDRCLRTNIPQVYPKLLEISKDPINVSSLVEEQTEIDLVFANKTIQLNPSFDTTFYRNYSNKKITFAKPSGDIQVLVCVDKINDDIKEFLTTLALEYNLRNQSELKYNFGSFDPEKNNFKGYDLVLTIASKRDTSKYYDWYKKTLENEMGLAHQHVTLENADYFSVMQLVMQICLKLGGDPWLLPNYSEIPYVVGVNNYYSTSSEQSDVSIIVINNEGSLIKQYDPIGSSIEDATQKLLELNEKYQRVLFLVSYERTGLIQNLEEKLETTEKLEYAIIRVLNNSSFRFFKTYRPKKAPRFGKIVENVAKCSVEAYESAPQGAILRADEQTFYLLTGKTIEKEAMKRGCPTPIKIEVMKTKGKNWNLQELAKYILKLCMMGRASGHMTRFPMPLYYLQSRSYYINSFGAPKIDKLKNRIFYI